jgi:hypothetical protein
MNPAQQNIIDKIARCKMDAPYSTPANALVRDVVDSWDYFSAALDCSDAEEEMTENQRSKYSRLSDAIARLRTSAAPAKEVTK